MHAIVISSLIDPEGQAMMGTRRFFFAGGMRLLAIVFVLTGLARGEDPHGFVRCQQRRQLGSIEAPHEVYLPANVRPRLFDKPARF